MTLHSSLCMNSDVSMDKMCVSDDRRERLQLWLHCLLHDDVIWVVIMCNGRDRHVHSHSISHLHNTYVCEILI